MANEKGVGGFEKGVSGNPNGRPSFRDAINRLGAMMSDIELDGRTLNNTEAAVLASIELAKKGDTNAIKFLAQHSEGTKVVEESKQEITINVRRVSTANKIVSEDAEE
jgi:hypothetical protein